MSVLLIGVLRAVNQFGFDSRSVDGWPTFCGLAAESCHHIVLRLVVSDVGGGLVEVGEFA